MDFVTQTTCMPIVEKESYEKIKSLFPMCFLKMTPRKTASLEKLIFVQHVMKFSTFVEMGQSLLYWKCPNIGSFPKLFLIHIDIYKDSYVHTYIYTHIFAYSNTRPNIYS
jgi:hypothetical protein